MKYLQALVIAISALLTFNASAASISIFQAGDFEITGSIFVDITSNPTFTVGIGQVDSVRQDGNVIWTSGTDGNYLNYYFDEYITSSVIPITPTQSFFTANGGIVRFWKNDGTVFDASQDYLTQRAAMETGELLVDTVGIDETSGIFSSSTYATNGWLNVVGGSQSAIFDTDTLTTLNSLLVADMTFNVSADTIHGPGVHPDYLYSGSSDLNGAVAPVPAPATLLLLGTGLIGLSMVRRKTV